MQTSCGRKVSIITVVKNGESFLENTISSVLYQTYDDIEYIIIDGGSQDNTIDIIRKYEEDIKKWSSAEDDGIYDAMNKGVKLSSGDYLMFINAGDRLANKRTVEDLVRVLEKEKVEIVYGDTILHEKTRSRLWKAREINDLWKNALTAHQSIICSRNLLVEHPFDKKLKIAADCEWVNFCYYQKKATFFYYPKPVAIYLKGGFSEKRRVRTYIERWIGIRHYKKEVKVDLHYLKLIFSAVKNYFFA